MSVGVRSRVRMYGSGRNARLSNENVLPKHDCSPTVLRCLSHTGTQRTACAGLVRLSCVLSEVPGTRGWRSAWRSAGRSVRAEPLSIAPVQEPARHTCSSGSMLDQTCAGDARRESGA